MFIIRDTAGQVHRVQSLEAAARIVELDPHDIAWALEEYGRCETDTHSVTVVEGYWVRPSLRQIKLTA